MELVIKQFSLPVAAKINLCPFVWVMFRRCSMIAVVKRAQSRHSLHIQLPLPDLYQGSVSQASFTQKMATVIFAERLKQEQSTPLLPENKSYTLRARIPHPFVCFQRPSSL
jgi:hypothetical protein